LDQTTCRTIPACSEDIFERCMHDKPHQSNVPPVDPNDRGEEKKQEPIGC